MVVRQDFEQKGFRIMGGFGGDYSACRLGMLGLGMGAVLAIATPAWAQITPAQDGINTQVQTSGAEITITGGQTSQGGENLFHSFDQFSVNAGETANFLTPSATEAVLGRIGGGDPSLINGTIQLTGSNADLFLLNPSGVVFGQNAALNVPASFGASTATGFGFQQDQWFGIGTGADVSGLTGELSALRFDGVAGVIANFGSLSVVPGANLWLVGGSVLNRGSLTASGGTVAITAVEGNQILQFGQPGNLLQFELSPLASGLDGGAIAPLSLPELLTGSELQSADQATVTEQGQIVLAGAQVNTQVAIAPGTTVLSGSIDVANSTGMGGQAVVTGTDIFVVDGTVDASGLLGGGRVAIGGEWQGGPGLPTAQNLWVGRNALVNASAVNQGNGGVVVFWSEGTTQFFGQVMARGGAIAGNGGLVEVSGRSRLGFDGRVDLSAPAGNLGSLLLDPERIVIVEGEADFDFLTENSDTPPGEMAPPPDEMSPPEGMTPPGEMPPGNGGGPSPDGMNGGMPGMDNPQPMDGMEGGMNAGAPPDASNNAPPSSGEADPQPMDGMEGGMNADAPMEDSSNSPPSSGGAQMGGVPMDGAQMDGAQMDGAQMDGMQAGGPSMDGMQADAPSTDSPNPPSSGGTNEGANSPQMGGMEASAPSTDSPSSPPSDGGSGMGDSAPLSGGSEPGGMVLSTRFPRNTTAAPQNITISAGDSPDSTLTITSGSLEAVQGGISLEATTEIVIADGVSLEFMAPENADPNAPPTPVSFSVTDGVFRADPTQQLVTNGRSLTIDAQSITVGSINTVGTDGNAANVDLNATAGTINSGFINVSATVSAGRVTVRAPFDDVAIAGIDARGGPEGFGGAIEIISGGQLQITGGFTDALGRLTSLATSGGLLSGNILIGQAGLIADPVVPFIIGDASENGTAGVIQAGGTDIAPPTSINTEFELNAAQSEMEPNSGAVQITNTGNADSLLEELSNNEGSELRSNLTQGSQSTSDSSFDNRLDDGDRVLPRGREPGIVRGVDTVSIGSDIKASTYRQDLADRRGELTPQEFVGNLEHLRAAEYGNHWGVSYQVPVVESSFDTIQEVLRAVTQDPGKVSVVLYTFAHEDELELVLVLPTGNPLRRTVENVSLKDLRRTTSQFRRQLTNRSLGSLPRYLPAAQKLYGWLIEPFREVLDKKNVEVIQFSLGPGLRSLPVAALHDGEQFLIENFAVATIPSFSLLNNEYQTLQNTTVLVAGTSQFDQLPELPAVPVEVDTIGTNWNTVNLIDEDFTLEEIRAARQQSNFAIAHLATHAFFEPGDRQDSFVQLWGNERVGVDAISLLNFHTPPLELLVLSACRTAVGDDSAELGFAGLSVQSGAKSVVASLWQVSDSGTLALMAEFYDALGNLPTKAEALRQAQLAMLRGEVTISQGQLQGTSRGAFTVPEAIAKGNLDFTHPYFWASFTLVGSPW